MEIPSDYAGLYLRLVRAYKHMGTTSVGLVCNNHESKVRSAIMHTELRKSRATIYNNNLLERKVRFGFVESLLYSRLLFHCWLWRQMNVKSFARIRCAYMSPLRSVCNMHNRTDRPERFSNIQVLVDCQFVSASDRLRIARLRYLKRFLHKARQQLVRMALYEINDASSWNGLVIDDLDWLRQHVSMSEFPNPKSDPALALVAVKEYPSWKGVLGRAQRAMLEQVPNFPEATAPQDGANEFSCNLCTAVFPTKVQPHVQEARVYQSHQAKDCHYPLCFVHAGISYSVARFRTCCISFQKLQSILPPARRRCAKGGVRAAL